MVRRSVNPDGIKDTTQYMYSHANVDGDTIFVSGQVGKDENDNIVPGFEPQARQAFENVGVVLESVDKDYDDVAKVRSFVVDIQDRFDEYLDVWEEYWGTEPYPCSTAIGVPELAQPGLLIEVEVELGR